MTVFVIRDRATSNVACIDRKDEGTWSQLYAFRHKADAEVAYREIFKNDPDFYVDSMEIVKNRLTKQKDRPHRDKRVQI